MPQLKGKTAIVTGAASGIGAATARVFAREGANMILTDVDDARGKRFAEELGQRAVYLHHDVTDEFSWPKVIGAAEEQFGKLDVLVANAGIAIMGGVTELSLADWRRQTAVNLDGVFLSVKYAIPAMTRAGGGSIIMLSSVAGLRGSPNLACYSATKGGVRLFAKSVALECAYARTNIRVNSVHPGIIDTAIWGKMPAGNAALDPQLIADAMVPIGKPGQAEEVAAGILFLASDAASHITGSELVIDGGMTAGGARRPQ
jgi:NAD(P)-dependent dehydrogenase (short-subunit alcohol dehydrogenase family)